jgi:hypothetical protein
MEVMAVSVPANTKHAARATTRAATENTTDSSLALEALAAVEARRGKGTTKAFLGCTVAA